MAPKVLPEIGERVMVCHHCLWLSQQEQAKWAQMSVTSLNRLELGRHSVSAERWRCWPRCATSVPILYVDVSRFPAVVRQGRSRGSTAVPMNRPESCEKSVSTKRTGL